MSCNCNSGVSEINTSTCEEPCNSCGAGVNSTSSCGTSTCGCNSAVPGTSTPYYNCAEGVQETHCKTVVQALYEAALTSSTAFNMPACLENAVISFPGLKKIQPGSYLWNATYGYLKVMSFDYVSSQVTVKNTCETGNASPGTAIPSCTLFNVVDEPCCDGTNGQVGVFLETDFVAPADGNCIDIEVTGVAGLTIGSSVQISSGVYNVNAIVTPTVITICNGGSGVAHGTTVDAKDGSGSYITPITPLSTNACANAAATRGVLVICDNGTQRPLTPTAIGQVPSVVDVVNKEVEFVTLSIPVETCTLLDADITLIAGTITYTVLVASSASFAIGNLIVIHFGAYETVRWLVTGVPDPTHVTIERTTAQAGNDVIPAGNSFCLASCCEQLSQGLGSTLKWDDGIPLVQARGIGETASGNVSAVTFTNTTPNLLNFLVNVDYSVAGYLEQVLTLSDTLDMASTSPHVHRVVFNTFAVAEEIAVGGVFADPALVQNGVFNDRLLPVECGLGAPEDVVDYSYAKTFHYSMLGSLAPGRQMKIRARCDLVYACGTIQVPPVLFQVNAVNTRIHGIGVSV